MEGRNYNVDVFYLDKKEPPGYVLVLLTAVEEVDHCVNMLKNYIDTDLISDPRDLEVEVSSVEQVTEEINTLALTGDSEVKKIS